MAEVSTVIRAAGGVVWREAPGGVEIALVHRPRYEDWSLPKGKLEPGEHVLAAAVREVFEETLVRAVPQVRLPSIRYLTGQPGVEKVVDFWSMRAVAWTDRTADDEIDEVRWVPAHTAGTLLSYAHDRGVARFFLDLPPVTAMIAFARHARAGRRDEWSGPDDARPLDDDGRRESTALASLLGLFQPARVVSATPLRCRQTVEPLGLPVRLDPAFDETAPVDDAVRALRRLALVGGVTVVCSQGKLMEPVLARLAGRASAEFGTRKGTTWMLGFSENRLVGQDHLDALPP